MMPNNDLLWQHLKLMPAFRALLRSVEARFYQSNEIKEPILDLGCGDGLFAELALARGSMVGIDPWSGPLQKANALNVHSLLAQSVGQQLPFPDNSFNSIVSNSVFEHIHDITPVLIECSRILVPNGKLYFTVPNSQFTEYLGGALLLERLGLAFLADIYRNVFNSIARHAHTDSPQVWAERLSRAGFTVESWRSFFSIDALHALELGHIQGLPSALIHLFTGHWILAPWRSNLALTERWIRPYYAERPPEIGTMLFIEANNVPPEPDSVLLPKPLTSEARFQDEPIAGTDDEGIEIDSQIEIGTIENSKPYREDLPKDKTSDLTTSDSIARRDTFMFRRMASFLIAAIGLAMLRKEPPSIAAALLFTSVGLGGIAGILKLSSLVTVGIRTTRRIRQGWWPVVVGLGLSYGAGRLVNDPGQLQRPLLSIILWLLAIIISVIALWKPARKWGTRTPTSDRRSIDILGVGFFLVTALVVRLFLLDTHPFILSGIEANIGLDTRSIVDSHLRSPFATAWFTTPTLPLFLQALPLKAFGVSTFTVRLLPSLVGAVTVPVIFLVGSRMWGRTVGWVAGILLLGAHVHVHYSRQGMTNIWDPFLMLLIVGSLYWAWISRRRQAWIVTGITTGLGVYFFTTSRVLPLLLLFLAILMLFRGKPIRQQASNILAAGLVALVTALPQVAYYWTYPEIFWDRVQATSILQGNWLLEESARTGKTIVQLLSAQFWSGSLALFRGNDTSIAYNSGRPIFSLWIALFLLIGLALITIRFRQTRSFLILLWFVPGTLLIGVLTIQPPASHRLLIVLPVAIILASIGLVWTAQWFGHALGIPAYRSGAAAILLAILLMASDLLFYFGQYRIDHSYGDRNTEFAYRASQYINDLEGAWTVYLYGPPAIYSDFPTFSFLVEGWQENIHFIDSLGPGDNQQPALTEHELHLFLPERSREIQDVASVKPSGILASFDGKHSSPLFFAYEIR